MQKESRGCEEHMCTGAKGFYESARAVNKDGSMKR